MPREDRDAVYFLEHQLKKDGCEFWYETQIERFEHLRQKSQTDDGRNIIWAVRKKEEGSIKKVQDLNKLP